VRRTLDNAWLCPSSNVRLFPMEERDEVGKVAIFEKKMMAVY
jgi:hypothetical protein